MRIERWRRLAWVWVVALTLVWPAPAAAQTPTTTGGAAAGYPNAALLVDTGWLAARLDDVRVRIFDMRPHEAYAQDHIPGAVNVVKDDIVSTIDNVPALFDPDKVRSTLSAAGLTPDMAAVIYDDLGMMDAARMFWTLERAGHPDARLLNGGWYAWTQASQPTTTAASSVTRTSYSLRLDPMRVATWDYVLAHLDDPHVALVDARTEAEYTGAVKRAARGGHIPGAVRFEWLDGLTGAEGLDTNIPEWVARLHAPGAGFFKPAGEIETLLAARGITHDKQIVPYCQTFWRGAHVYFLLRLMGFTDIRGYDGSWVEWGNRPDLPVVAGTQPGSLKSATTGP